MAQGRGKYALYSYHAQRAKLFPNDPQKVVATYTEAVKTVDPEQATGKVNFSTA